MSTLLYNPDKKNKQQFIAEFVVRTSVFEELFKDIQSGKMKTPEQHYLLVGQRGSGKTTLLNRLKYAIDDDAKLNKWLIPVIFNEEQYHIIELANLWENIANYLEDLHGFKGLTEEIEKYISNKNFEQIALDILIKYLDKHGKKIVLFIDNIGDLLKKFDELEVHRLREILQTVPHIRLIAGSPVVLESTTDYHQPLFEFFKVIQLKGLTSEETILLLKKLAEINNQTKKIEAIISKTPSRIETLRTLSGGVPRTIALLFIVFIDDEHGNALTDLEKILDMVTPLYKHRMDDLPTQQQKIVDAVAKNWDAVSVKELSETLRMESKAISAQLRQLEQNQVIEKRTTNTKNHIYLIKERFFNIWYLMRYGRKQDKQRVIWLVKFLEMWCDGKEIEKRILNYAEKAKKGTLDKATHEFYGEVYSFFEKIEPETKLLLKETAPEYISKYIQLTDEEFNNVIDIYFKNKDWENFIKISLEADLSSENKKQKLFTLLDNNKANKLREIIKTEIDIILGEPADKIIDMPHFYVIYMLYYLIQSANFTNLEDEIKGKFSLISKLYNVIQEEDLSSEFEDKLMRLFILKLLTLKYYHLSLLLFSENEKLKQNLKLIYITAFYFANNKNNNIFDKYGSEIKDSVLSLSSRIIEMQKLYSNKN
jgi:GTPase SAR1 family protein